MGNRKEEQTGRHFTRWFCGKYSQNMTEVSLPVAGGNLYSPWQKREDFSEGW